MSWSRLKMVGKKKIKLTDEQMAEKVVPAKISDKEMQSLADDGMAKKIFNALVAVGEQYDRTVSGPMRTAILESIKKDPIRGISEGIKSIRGEDHASGEDIAGALGVPETVDLVPNFAANLVPSDPKIKFPIKKVLGFAAEVGVDLPYGTILKSP